MLPGARPQGDGARGVGRQRRDAEADEGGEGEQRAPAGDGVDPRRAGGDRDEEDEAGSQRAGEGCSAASPRLGRQAAVRGARLPGVRGAAVSHARGVPRRERPCARRPAQTPSTSSRNSHPTAGTTATSQTPQATTDSLEIRDSRTGKTYTVPITDGTIRTSDLRQIKVDAERLRAADVRPGVHEHGVVQERRSRSSTATRGSCATAATPSSSWRRRRRSSRWPTCCATASCPTRRSTTRGCTTSRSTPTCTRTSASSSRASATTRTP